jgi:hypothetical protein
METFDQTNVFSSGCMRCHTVTQNDFLWSLAINAYRDKSGLNPTTISALKGLSDLQKSAIAANEAQLRKSTTKPAGKAGKKTSPQNK